MKIGINLWIWGSPFRTDQNMGLINQAKSLGAEVVEFAMEDDAVIDAKVLRRVLQQEAMECSVIGLFGPDRDLSMEDAAVRRRGMDYARRCIDVCAEAGATIFTGAAVGVDGKELLSDAARRTRLRHAAESLQQLGQYAADAGVRLGVEVLNRYEDNLLNTAGQARELIDLTDHPAVGIHLDSFHMNIEETAFGDAIRLAGDRLFHFHGSDNHRGTPGEGMLRWQEVAAALKEIDYQGYVVIESFDYTSRFGPVVHFWRPLAESPEAVARNGLAFLKALLRGS